MSRLAIIVLFCASGCATTHTHSQYVSKQTLASVTMSYSAVVDRLQERVDTLEKEVRSLKEAKRQTNRVSDDARILYLTLPGSEQEEEKRTVTVRRGDTFVSIARKEDVDVWKLIFANKQFNPTRIDGFVDKKRRKNDWDPDYLIPGDELVLP